MAQGIATEIFLEIDIVIVLGAPEAILMIGIGIDLEIDTVIILGICIIRMVVGMVLEIILVRGIDNPQLIGVGVMRLTKAIQGISRLIIGVVVHMKLFVIIVIGQVILLWNALTLDVMHAVEEVTRLTTVT